MFSPASPLHSTFGVLQMSDVARLFLGTIDHDESSVVFPDRLSGRFGAIVSIPLVGTFSGSSQGVLVWILSGGIRSLYVLSSFPAGSDTFGNDGVAGGIGAQRPSNGWRFTIRKNIQVPFRTSNGPSVFSLSVDLESQFVSMYRIVGGGFSVRGSSITTTGSILTGEFCAAAVNDIRTVDLNDIVSVKAAGGTYSAKNAVTGLVSDGGVLVCGDEFERSSFLFDRSRHRLGVHNGDFVPFPPPGTSVARTALIFSRFLGVVISNGGVTTTTVDLDDVFDNAPSFFIRLPGGYKDTAGVVWLNIYHYFVYRTGFAQDDVRWFVSTSTVNVPNSARGLEILIDVGLPNLLQTQGVMFYVGTLFYMGNTGGVKFDEPNFGTSNLGGIFPSYSSAHAYGPCRVFSWTGVAGSQNIFASGRINVEVVGSSSGVLLLTPRTSHTLPYENLLSILQWVFRNSSVPEFAYVYTLARWNEYTRELRESFTDIMTRALTAHPNALRKVLKLDGTLASQKRLRGE